MRSTTLSELCANDATFPEGSGTLQIAGLALDSRQVQPGFLFAALSGAARHGREFVGQALEKGAVALLADDGLDLEQAEAVVTVRAPDARRAFSLMAARFFKEQPECVVAITGTSGKTSTAAFVRQIFQRLGHSSAAIGTLGVTRGDGSQAGSLTTPDTVSLHKMLASLAGDGITHLAIEASSHGLEQRRLDGMKLEAAAFTNLGRDHLDYHPTMEDYFQAKSRLFDPVLPPGKSAVVWLDSGYSTRIVDLARARNQRVLTVGMARGDISIDLVRPSGSHQIVGFTFNSQQHTIQLPLPGLFQVANAMMAAALAIQVGLEPNAVFSSLETLKGARGRLENIGTGTNGGTVFIDYCHKPDAVEEALKALRPFADGKVVIVIGAGGDRDTGKRTLMGEAAARYADIVIVTDDNPRSEDPATIRAAVRKGAPGSMEIGDRREAIRAGLNRIEQGDLLLVAGKGHETGQEIKGVKHPFSDHDVVLELLEQGH
ncbi:MAG: UDP-N-acetylmuramoyl-L-alanyl-D-glutamate--2,6-diaminopimelate ligase [Pseudomonadota bacterium]